MMFYLLVALVLGLLVWAIRDWIKSNKPDNIFDDYDHTIFENKDFKPTWYHHPFSSVPRPPAPRPSNPPSGQGAVRTGQYTYERPDPTVEAPRSRSVSEFSGTKSNPRARYTSSPGPR